MFTGIIENLGIVLEKTGSILRVQSDKRFLAQLQKGLSVAINGICLTVADKTSQSFTADFMPETAKRTNIKYLKINDLVNLELPVTPSTFLSGHIVQGHVDDLAKLIKITKNNNSHILKFSFPNSLSKYIIEKGSIAVNGISLTVIETKDDFFTVGIIPHTWENTMLHRLKIKDFVNIEVDVLAKYLERMIR